MIFDERMLRARGPHETDRTAGGSGLSSLRAAGDDESRASEPGPRAWCDIPAGAFDLGNAGADAIPGDGEGPVRRVDLEAFRIGSTTVTNAEFAAFVRAARHVTEAERLGSSFVFYLQLPEQERSAGGQVVSGLLWWVPVEHASWQRPEGPGSHVRDRMGRPVVHVSWHDALAYCEWAGARLPGEDEWECPARGGLRGRRFAWGDDLFDAADVPRCNVFSRRLPERAGGRLAAPPGRRRRRRGERLRPDECLRQPLGVVRRRARRRPPAAARRLVPLPRLLLQPLPLPRRGAQLGHRRHVDTSTSHIGFRVAR